MIDAYYTPPELARAMVDLIPNSLEARSAADFAAGEGSLLYAAAQKWPQAVIHANDLSPTVSRRLERFSPHWHVSCTDFLNDESASLAKFYAARGSIDVVLINPPFSERGRRLISWSDMGFDFVSGIATAFLYKALTYISSNGVLVAVLPDGCLVSVRDERAWNVIHQLFHVEVIQDNSRSAFKGASARTSLVRIRRRNVDINRRNVTTVQLPNTLKSFKVIRGTVQMHKIPKAISGAGLPLIHTSQLVGGRIELVNSQHVQLPPAIDGPGVLFPRVGRVTPQKIGILRRSDQVVLSDCILGVKCKNEQQAIDLRDAILLNWSKFAQAYRGTGAPYITVVRATEILKPLVRSLKDRENNDNYPLENTHFSAKEHSKLGYVGLNQFYPTTRSTEPKVL